MFNQNLGWFNLINNSYVTLKCLFFLRFVTFFLLTAMFFLQMYRAEEQQSDRPDDAGGQFHERIAAQASLRDSSRLAEAQSKVPFCVGAPRARAPKGQRQRKGQREGKVWITAARVSPVLMLATDPASNRFFKVDLFFFITRVSFRFSYTDLCLLTSRICSSKQLIRTLPR